MPRAQRLFAWITALAVGVCLAQGWRSAVPSLETTSANGGATLLGPLLLSLLSGRLLLSFLPPGHLGGHGPRELPATLAASHALGQTLVLAAGATPLAAWHPLLLGAVLLLLFLWRWTTLPAALVPRRAPAPEPRSIGAMLAPLVLLAVAVLVATRRPTLPWSFDRTVSDLAPAASSTPTAVLHWLAAVTLVASTLRTAGCGRIGRTLAWLAVALGPWAVAGPEVTRSFLLHAAGIAGSAAWLQRASRRGLAVGTLGWAGVALAGAPGTAVLAAVLLPIASARTMRASVARGTLLVVGASLAVSLLVGPEVETKNALSLADGHGPGPTGASPGASPGALPGALPEALAGVLAGVLGLAWLAARTKGPPTRDLRSSETGPASKRLKEPRVEGVGGGSSGGGGLRGDLAWGEGTFCQLLLASTLFAAWVLPALDPRLRGLVDPVGLVPVTGLVAALALARPSRRHAAA